MVNMQAQVIETHAQTVENTADLRNVISAVKELAAEVRISNRTQIGILLTAVGYLVIYWVKGGA
jgi:hypothetical protein